MVKKNIKDFIDKSNLVHEYKYDYSLVNYINNITNIKIICPEHGDFYQRPIHHLRGSGCKKCNNGRKKLKFEYVIERFIEKHKDKYSYSKVIYTDIHKHVIITCKIHNDFLQTPHKHMNGRGCPKCGDKCGVKENKWLDSLGVINRQVRIDKYIVDGYDPLTKTIYEFNGDFWHGNPVLYNQNDYNLVSKKTFGELYKKTIDKEKHLVKCGYNVISIWESDFNKQIYQH